METDEHGFPMPIYIPAEHAISGSCEGEYQEEPVRDAAFYNRRFLDRREARQNNTVYNQK